MLLRHLAKPVDRGAGLQWFSKITDAIETGARIIKGTKLGKNDKIDRTTVCQFGVDGSCHPVHMSGPFGSGRDGRHIDLARQNRYAVCHYRIPSLTFVSADLAASHPSCPPTIAQVQALTEGHLLRKQADGWESMFACKQI